MTDGMKTFRFVCKSCEQIIKPRLELEGMWRESNSHCPDCGSKIGKLVGSNPDLHYIGKDNDDHPVYILHEGPPSGDDIEEFPQPIDVEDYL